MHLKVNRVLPSESGELGLASRPGQPGLPDNPGSCISGGCREPGEAGKPGNDGTDDGHDELAAGKPGRPGYTAYVQNPSHTNYIICLITMAKWSLNIIIIQWRIQDFKKGGSNTDTWPGLT